MNFGFSNHYSFFTHWRMEGDIAEIYTLISNPLDYPNWWKNVCFQVEELEPGDKRKLGQVIRFQLKAALPYVLKWQAKSTELNKPYGFTSEVTGDLVGLGVWSFKQDGSWVDITFNWEVAVEKPFLRFFSFFLRPVFNWNHNWVMKKWEESLRSELRSRRRSKVTL